jgi:hypothetical protein
MKGNEENIANYRGSPRAMRRKSSFCVDSPPSRETLDKPLIPTLIVPQEKGSPRSQLLSALSNEEEISAAGLNNLQIVDIIRDAVTRKSLKMTTLQNSIYDLRERIHEEERKGQKVKLRMEKLGLTPRK